MDKTMEKEYKWRADEKLLGQALLWASSRIGSQSRTINMESSYFDTADGLLKEHQAALRLRRENDRSVCCMKLRNTDTPDGMRAHEEYQCEAVSLLDGLRRLPELGAPNDLCTVSFRRSAVLLQEGDTVCEMALDEGELRHNGKSAPLSWRSSLTSWLSRPASWRERWRCKFRFTRRLLYSIMETEIGE